MAMDFKLPELGENIASGDVVSVLVNEGDVIAVNQGVVELETDKAVVEVPSSHAGKVTKIHVKKGQTVPIGGLLISLEADAPAEAAAASTKAPAAPPSQPAAAKTEERPRPVEPPPQRVEPKPAPMVNPVPVAVKASAPPAPPRESNGGPAPAGPATRRFARELGVDLHNVHGTGAGGRISREDIVEAVRRMSAGETSSGQAAAPAPTAAASGASSGDRDNWGAVRRESLTKIRKAIAANMARSHTTIPHVTNFDDADITELERIRKGSMADYVDKNVKLTMMAFTLKAVAHALRLHPAINASLDMESEQVVYKQYVNIGVAVDTDRGLVVPAMRNVDRMSIPQIAQALTGIAQQARDNKFTLDDLRGGTFTISNLGAIGGTYSTPIINFPEVAILLVGRSRKLPVVVNDEIQPRLMMPLSLSYDHRWVDGATAARFLNEVIGFLEVPGRLLLAP